MFDGCDSKFTYATRDSSTAFCNAIVINGNSGMLDCKNKNKNDGKKLSEIIKDEKWYFNHWNNDPTAEYVNIVVG